jgi:hypothetical protein
VQAAGCINHGPEFGRNFVLRARHQGKPLEGVRVEISGRSKIEQATGLNGEVSFTIFQLVITGCERIY